MFHLTSQIRQYTAMMLTLHIIAHLHNIATSTPITHPTTSTPIRHTLSTTTNFLPKCCLRCMVSHVSCSISCFICNICSLPSTSSHCTPCPSTKPLRQRNCLYSTSHLKKLQGVGSSCNTKPMHSNVQKRDETNNKLRTWTLFS